MLICVPAIGETWYVRPDGGTRSRKDVPGQCDGKADVAYRGSGIDQHCAFNDFRYLYNDKSYNGIAGGWIIAGGDTVIVRGCHDPNGGSSTDCRIGSDPPGVADKWCVGNAIVACSSGPSPSGTAAQHTRILGQNYKTCSADNITNRSKLTRLFGGNGLGTAINLQSTRYVDFECIDLSDHSECVEHGSPAYPGPCTGKEDFAKDGMATNNRSADILLEDVWIHGFTRTGITGPIGGLITLRRVKISFNGFAGWNFDDGGSTPDAPGSAIDASYVSMIGNGCNEEYPIVDAFPARSCYDLNDGGFGDSWSGQNTALASFTCDHCVMAYNTKDGFIGPHTLISKLIIRNSQSYGNMGQQWKWGSEKSSSTIFENNLTIGNCRRMSAPLPGAPSGYNRNLSLYCRADGDIFSFFSSSNSTVLFSNDTTIGYSATMFDLACATEGTCGSTKFIFRNDIMLGLLNPSYNPGNAQVPGLFYYSDTSDTVTADHNIYYNLRSGTVPGGTLCRMLGSVTSIACVNPLFVNQPALTIKAEAELDGFNFHPAGGSPAIGHGSAESGVTTDFYGVTRPNPPSIGAVEPAPDQGVEKKK